MRTHIEFILDKSGSMYSRIDDVIGGFNSFVKEQRDLPGELTFNLTLFADKVVTKEQVEFPYLDRRNYVPAGNTALLDAIGTRISALSKSSSCWCGQCNPEKIIFVIITDGEENASKIYTKAQIKEMSEHQQKQHNWQFVFLGADIDAFRDGSQLGFATASTMAFKGDDYHKTYTILGSSVAAYRSGVTGSVSFTGDGK